MIKLRKKLGYYSSPDIRILLIHVASKHKCAIEFDKDDGLFKVTIVGIPKNVHEAESEFRALWVEATFKQAVVVAMLPAIPQRTVERDFMNGFVCKACSYLTNTPRKPLNISSATILGEASAETFFRIGE